MIELSNDIDSLIESNAYEDAISLLNIYLSENPLDDRSWTKLGICFYNLNKTTIAIEQLEAAYSLNPQNPSTLISLAVCYSQIGLLEKAAALADEAVILAPNHSQIWSNWAYIKSASTDDRLEILNIYKKWGSKFADPITDKYLKETKYNRVKNSKLKIGFVSGDIRQHSILYFTMPFFQNYDKSRLEVHIYQTLIEDDYSQKVKEIVDAWHNVADLSDVELYNLIRKDNIDVLIDLSGHTTGSRLNVFAMKPCLIQATWLGYMNTLGMKAMDYRITDWGLDPTGSEIYYTENLLRLNSTAMYWPPESPEIPNFLPASVNGYVTLVSPNNLRKLNPFMLEAWNEILRKNPSTRLLIISNDDDVKKSSGQLSTLLGKFKHISEQSLIMPRLSLQDFMSLAYVADLALDSYPISGGTTTLHALWMGLPVICMDSDNPMSAASSKTLTGVGLTQCIANNREEFIAKACELINDKEKLLQLRLDTRSYLLKSPLMDYRSRVDDLTNALINAWNLAA